MNLLYFASSTHGGLADYSREQVAALARSGVRVDLLCAPDFPKTPDAPDRRTESLRGTPPRTRPAPRLRRALDFARLTLFNQRQLRSAIVAGNHRHVLLGAYSEYFAPLWAPGFRRLARRGVRFGAVVHDPVRDAVLGPAWWHRRSVAAAYSFLAEAFVHAPTVLDTGSPGGGPRVTVVPHGPYRLQTRIPSRSEARERLGLPAEAPVLLAFGHLRDNKNLHLAIEAMAAAPTLHLVVAGSELSSGNRPAAFYQDLAKEHGVSGRCRWTIGFIAEEDVGLFFAAADFIALTYSRGFRSASGVLNVASQFRKTCLASGGPGPLREQVERYDLGLWVEPDSAKAIADGLRELIARGPQPRWDAYDRENSWDENARRVAQTLFDQEP